MQRHGIYSTNVRVPVFDYFANNSLPLIPFLRHINILHTLPSCYFSIQFNNILSFT
jgi:hypothetical protein